MFLISPKKKKIWKLLKEKKIGNQSYAIVDPVHLIIKIIIIKQKYNKNNQCIYRE